MIETCASGDPNKIVEYYFIYRKMYKDEGQPTLRLFLIEKLERQFLAFENAVGNGGVQVQELAFRPKH